MAEISGVKVVQKSGFGPVRNGRFLRPWQSLIEKTKIFQPPHQVRVPKCSILLIFYAKNGAFVFACNSKHKKVDLVARLFYYETFVL